MSENKQQQLDRLYQKYLPHTVCPLKRPEKHSMVFGSGNPDACLMIVGEAPGKTEDEQGLPFVGRSGKLLTKALESLGIDREKIFITNVVKCRPQNNRTPNKKECAAYIDILKSQIEIIKPAVICALGKIATESLLGQQKQGDEFRGKIQYCNKIPIIPTYHPAYILRNPSKSNTFLENLAKAATFYRNC